MEVNSIKPKYKVVPPEGGYGYVVCVAFIILMIVVFSPSPSFSMLYGDFFHERNSGIGGLTMVTGVTGLVISFSGILTSVALKRFSHRQVALVGALCVTLQWFINVFITEIYQMAFTNGILAGMGIGLTSSTSIAVFNSYFVEKRTMMVSTCQLFIGLADMLCPILIEKSLREYGFRGTLLIFSAIVSNSVFSALCLHPVHWHSKSVIDENECSLEDGKKNLEKQHEKELLINTEPSKANILLTNSRFSVRPVALEHYSLKNKPEVKFMDQNKPGIWEVVVKFLDLSLLKDVIFLNIVFGLSFAMLEDSLFLLMLPLHLESIGFPKADVARCLALMSSADLVSKGVMAVVCHFIKIRNRTICFVSAIGIILSRLLFLQCYNYWSLLVIASVMGFLRGLLFMPVTLIYADHAPDRFPAAFGIGMLVMGILSTILIPAFGFLGNKINNYVILFYSIISLPLMTVTLWTIEFICDSKETNTAKPSK